MVWSAVFTATRDREIASSTLGRRVMLFASLGKMLYDNFLCLADSNKQQISKSKDFSKIGIMELEISQADTRPMYNAPVVFQWMKDKNGTN